MMTEGEGPKLRWYWKISILSCIIFGFITLMPWYNIRANFLGYYSTCSFVPFSSIAVFTLSFALYAYVTKRRKTLYGTTLIFLTILGFTSWWFYNFKLPMDNLEFSMAIRSFWIGTTSYYDNEENASSINFNLSIKNPTDKETPVFLIEPRDIAINNKKLISYYELSCLNGTSTYHGLRWFYKPTTLKAYENITLEIRCFVRYKTMEVETATREDIWASLVQRNFTLIMSGILTVRPYFNLTIAEHDPSIEDKSTWAARLFIISQQYR